MLEKNVNMCHNVNLVVLFKEVFVLGNPFLLDFHDLVTKADKIKQNLWGDRVFFIRNIHLNYTNICTSHCKFCAFAKNVGDDGAYSMTPDEAVEYVANHGQEANEVHIVGGLHPHFPLSYYTDMISALKTNFPNIVVKAFSAVEIDYFADISGKSIVEVLHALRDAGLGMMPGGGAEIFAPAVRNKICPEKIPADRWLEIHEIAHKEGIVTNATMLYGHLESVEDRYNHLLALRELQEKTNGFSAFIPLSFQPDDTFLNGHPHSTGIEDLTTIAASRIVLDNVPHIKAYWVMLGAKTAQLSLRMGADDLDGTIVKENIANAAGGNTSEAMTADELIYMVKAANLIPVERDSFYKEVKNYG